MVPDSRELEHKQKGPGRIQALCGLRLLQVFQYLRTEESISFDHAVMPPARLCSFLKPFLARNSAAFWLRPPDLHCTTISCSGFSSPTRCGNSPSGISFPPICAI